MLNLNDGNFDLLELWGEQTPPEPAPLNHSDGLKITLMAEDSHLQQITARFSMKARKHVAFLFWIA